ncbi:MAG TPA: hypothetical protein VK564_06470, partial [Thermodesulfobacteriota bacterium]|nr:hypothetical protein [Thermodesulfobacteriota bacterium]
LRDDGSSARPPSGGIITKSEAPEESPGLDLQSFVENFEKKLEQARGPLSGDPPGDRENQSKIRSARSVLKEINPTLQNQLRSFDFEAVLNRPTSEEAKWLSDDWDAKTAVKKLREFNESNLELSPALTGFIKKMLAISDQNAANGSEQETLGPEKGALVQLDQLFKREAYEKYVIPEYNQLLKDISVKASPAGTREKAFPVEDHKHSFEDIYAVKAMARVLLSALQQESTQEEYTAYLENVVLTSQELLAHAELPLLSELLNLLLLHSQEASESFRPPLAQKSLEAFRTWGAIHKIVDLLDGPNQRPYSDLCDLAKVLGPEIVPEVVDLVGEKSSPSARKFLTELLNHYKQCAQVEIERRLTRNLSSIPGYLFTLIRDLGLEADLATTLKQLLDQADTQVQERALEALIRIKDDTAINILRWLIASEKKEGYEKGVEMAVRFKVVETVPYLINAVNQALFLMRDFPKKVTMLRALGRIGAAEAIPFLEALAQKKWAISRKKLTHLKVVLFQTLDGFRPNQIENLIRIGDGLSDAQITAALRRWRSVGNGKG